MANHASAHEARGEAESALGAACGAALPDGSGLRACLGQGGDAELIIFRVGGKLFALGLGAIQEVVRSAELTRLPAAPNYVPGVLNLRGRVTPVIRLRTLLGVEDPDAGQDRFIVICHHQGLRFGLLITAVVAMRRVPPAAFDFDVAGRLGENARYLSALVRTGDGLVSLLSMDDLIRGVLLKEGEADG